MKARWQALSAKFAALSLREKWMVVAAAFFAVGFGGYTVSVEPALIKARALEKQLIQQRADLAMASSQLATLKAQYRDPDGVTRASLAEAQGKLADLERHLREYDSALVPPNRMPELLNALLARHRGLQVVSVRTLAPQPLLAPVTKDGAKAALADSEKSPVGSIPAKPELRVAEQGANNLFKHGIEIKVAGSYPDLLSYLTELEGAAQKLLWDEMKLSVVAYPRSELTLRLYTLSLETIWLVV